MHRCATPLEDLGLPQQVELYERFGGPILDSANILTHPTAALTALCDAVGIAFTPAMLSWPAGPHPADGVWAEHWYAGGRASTGFTQRPAGSAPAVELPERLEPLLARSIFYYDALAARRLLAT